MPAKDAMSVAAACACQGLALIEIANENLFLLRRPHSTLPPSTHALSLANVSLAQRFMDNRQSFCVGVAGHRPGQSRVGSERIVLKFNWVTDILFLYN